MRAFALRLYALLTIPLTVFVCHNCNAFVEAAEVLRIAERSPAAHDTVKGRVNVLVSGARQINTRYLTAIPSVQEIFLQTTAILHSPQAIVPSTEMILNTSAQTVVGVAIAHLWQAANTSALPYNNCRDE